MFLTNTVKEEETFIDISKTCLSNTVWQHFLRAKSKQLAKCKLCWQILKIPGGSTSPMHTHLRSIHKKVLIKRNNGEVTPADDGLVASNACLFKKSKSIGDFFNSNIDESFSAVVARMVVLDGLPFRVFCTSIDLRTSLQLRGFNTIPKSATSIQKVVMDYGAKIRQSVMSEIMALKKQNIRFSLTLDEWTSSGNRRYMNVNIHGCQRVWSCGLSRITGKFASEDCVRLLERTLESFHLKIENDIMCIVSDGASMMQKVGRLLSCEQILCIAHGIQIAIVKVFYKKITLVAHEEEEAIDVNYLVSESEDENFSNDEGLLVELENNNERIEMTENFNLQTLVVKIRKIVKMFRSSPLKNEVLQKHVKDDHQKELQLLLDSKTRWSSMLTMLDRINLLKVSIRKSLIDVKADTVLSDLEWDTVSQIVKNLSPIKLAVDALCRADANLLSADATLTFMLDNLCVEDQIGRELQKELVVQINRRRTVLFDVLQYLKNLGKTKLHKSICRYSKTEINNTLILLNRKFNNESRNELDYTDSNDSDEISKVQNQISLAELLQKKIDESLSDSKLMTKVFKKSSLKSAVRSEIKFRDEGGSRGPLLESIYKAVMCIPPTSVAAERAFSVAGLFSTKIRSRLNDETLDTLCFLRSQFKNKY